MWLEWSVRIDVLRWCAALFAERLGGCNTALEIAEQQQVRQGDLMGYVGDTGNAQPGNYHLHFAVWQIDDPKHFWNGSNLNPYDLLRYANR